MVFSWKCWIDTYCTSTCLFRNLNLLFFYQNLRNNVFSTRTNMAIESLTICSEGFWSLKVMPKIELLLEPWNSSFNFLLARVDWIFLKIKFNINDFKMNHHYFLYFSNIHSLTSLDMAHVTWEGQTSLIFKIAFKIISHRFRVIQV